MTFQHRAGVSSYTSACAFAETCVFGKQLFGPLHCGLHFCRLPFSQSYGVNLPSSLTMVLSFVLYFSYRLPVSVCGTGTLYLLSSFSRQREFIDFVTNFHSPSSPRVRSNRTSQIRPLMIWPRLSIIVFSLSYCVTASVLYRNMVVLEYLPVCHHLRLSASA